VNGTAEWGPSFSFAFQPIVDTELREVFAYEALIRGPANEPAGTVFNAIESSHLHAFDRSARAQAIVMAASLGLRVGLSLNFLPRALETLPDAISSTFDAVRRAGLSPRRIYLEVTENELIGDAAKFSETLGQCRTAGMRLAIDDFGSGYSGLNLLADFQPDVLKIDMNLVRDIDSKGPRQAIVRAVIQACADLGIEVIAEGAETNAEYRWFKRTGVKLFQGYLFGRPTFESLSQPEFFG
jgi:EAL domain-containing protein (putative c-di-GMP-specific phosphodiesterase class I)